MFFSLSMFPSKYFYYRFPRRFLTCTLCTHAYCVFHKKMPDSFIYKFIARMYNTFSAIWPILNFLQEKIGNRCFLFYHHLSTQKIEQQPYILTPFSVPAVHHCNKHQTHLAVIFQSKLRREKVSEISPFACSYIACERHKKYPNKFEYYYSQKKTNNKKRVFSALSSNWTQKNVNGKQDF